MASTGYDYFIVCEINHNMSQRYQRNTIPHTFCSSDSQRHMLPCRSISSPPSSSFFNLHLKTTIKTDDGNDIKRKSRLKETLTFFFDCCVKPRP